MPLLILHRDTTKVYIGVNYYQQYRCMLGATTQADD